jgi:hypothetical protein
MPYKSKGEAVAAILSTRAQTEVCCRTGMSSALMSELRVKNAKVYKSWMYAKAQERMESSGMYDLVGYCLVACKNNELDDRHLYGTCDNTTVPSEPFEIYASDIYNAHLASKLNTCVPFLAAIGQKAPSKGPLDASDQVLLDLEQCVNNLPESVFSSAEMCRDIDLDDTFDSIDEGIDRALLDQQCHNIEVIDMEVPKVDGIIEGLEELLVPPLPKQGPIDPAQAEETHKPVPAVYEQTNESVPPVHTETNKLPLVAELSFENEVDKAIIDILALPKAVIETATDMHIPVSEKDAHYRDFITHAVEKFDDQMRRYDLVFHHQQSLLMNFHEQAQKSHILLDSLSREAVSKEEELCYYKNSLDTVKSAVSEYMESLI